MTGTGAGAVSATVKAARIRAAHASAAASSAAWTSHRGSPSPTLSPIPRTAARPTRGSIPSPARRRPPPSSTTATPEGARVDRAHEPGRRRPHRADHGRLRQVGRRALDDVAGPAQTRHHAGEALGRGTRCEAVAGETAPLVELRDEPAQDERCGGQLERHLEQPGVGRLAAQHGRAPRRPRARCRPSVPGTGPCRSAAPSQASPAPRATSTMLVASAWASSRPARKAPEPTFTSMTSACGPGGELLREDRGGDQRDALDRRRHVADGVEPAGRRGRGRRSGRRWRSRPRGPRAGAASRSGRRRVARDRLELVERAAGVAEAAAGEHRHVGRRRRPGAAPGSG